MLNKLGIAVMVLAVVALAMGIVFLQQGFSKEALLVDAMKQEKIELGEIEGIIDTAEEAQIAGDTVREHRHGISPTYGDLLGEERFNPENTTQLTYAQALNLENYLYLAVASFGMVTISKAAGAFMIIAGIVFGITGFGIRKISS
jgi:hypothetical protein